MVNISGSNLQPLLSCLEDSSSPLEDKTDAYLRLAEDLSKEDKQFVEEVCSFSSRILSAIARDVFSQRIDLSQAALQAVGYCIYQERIVSSLGEVEMSMILQDLCNVVMKSTDKNLCTRALWGISRQHLSIKVVGDKLPVILNTVEHALQTFRSTTVENESMDVIYRLISELPREKIALNAGQWSKLVYPLLISSAHKIREKALGILQLGLKLILLSQQDVVPQLVVDLKGGLLSELAKLFSDKKEVFVLQAWTVLVTILGETLHKGGNLINEMLKIPEQGFKSSLPNVQNISYSAWICLIDNFAISPGCIGSPKRIKLLMMPLLLKTNLIHKDIELGRLQAWWHLVCTIKSEIYNSTTFSEVCLPLLQYYFNVSIDSTTTPLGESKDGLRELTLPVTPVSRGLPNTPSSTKNTPRRKCVIFNKGKFSEPFAKQVMLLGCEMFMEILATNSNEVRGNKRLNEHLKNPILNCALFQERMSLLLAIVKSAFQSCGNFLDDGLAVSIWTNFVNWIVAVVQASDPISVDDIISSLFLTANDILTCSCLSPTLILKFLDVLSNIPSKYLLNSISILSSTCNQEKPVFLLADILFSQLSAFKESYVDERFHVVFENLIDVGFDAPTGKLTAVHHIWLLLEGLASTVANVEDLWRIWSKVTDSATDCVTKTSDVNQGDSLDPDFSLMISLLSLPFKQLFTGGLPVVTTKELDRDLAEFCRLFCRCASLVPAAEANTCTNELSKSLLTLVTLEKCKNVRFLDSICGFIYVMMDCFDFSAQNTRMLPTPSSRVNLTPGGISRITENRLGNLGNLVALSAKALSFSCKVDQDSSGSVIVAPAVTVLAGSLSKLFASLTNPQHIKYSVAALSSSICSFISHRHWSSSNSSDKKTNNTKYLLKIEKLWSDILTCLQSRYTAAYDCQMLEVMSDLLESTFCHQRRQFRNQTIIFWNATFGQVSYLEYPISLRNCLQTVLEKTPVSVPSWDQSKVTQISSLDQATSLQDSEEMTPKENIIKQDVVIANSPKRKHGGSSPGKLKGSFLHKAFTSDKSDRLSPFKNTLETGNKRKSPGSLNARRKLPLPLDATDDKDFVVIAPSPKKKRLLTEHQQEVRKEKKLESRHPALYNMLDQSQDGTQFSEWSQSTITQSFNHCDVEMPEVKGAREGNIEVDIQASLAIPFDKNNNSQHQVASNIIANGLDLVKNIEHADNLDNLPAMSTNITLPGGSYNSSASTPPETSSCTDLNTQLDDDEPIPSSQTSPTTSSRQKRRSYHRPKHTPRSTKRQPLSTDCLNSNFESKNTETDKMEPAEDRVDDVLLLTDLAESSTNSEPSSKQATEPTLDAKKQKSPKSSPISSRTRWRRNPTPYKAKKNVPSKAMISETTKEQEGTLEETQSDSADTEDFSDHQMDDTEIIERDILQFTSNSSNGDGVKDATNKTTSLIEPPSSPVASSVKFVHSKTSATGSPLNRPTRSFSSPACSPTTGILKRNRGKSETPSPPGKTRHVSFAFPLKEEKEISSYPMDQVPTQDDQNEETNSSEVTNNFTSIKTTKTKFSTPQVLKEQCVFPVLVECTTPVEQILPSLATSRFSRGLGHVVHAQNIRTVGNLSALTMDQVEKLPIRSPKVSTLRRVLKNFHENRAQKSSSKVTQLRAIKEISEDNDCEMEAEENIDTADKSTCNNTEELACEGNTPELRMSVTTPTTPHDHSKMLTPKRSRALVKPTTLFECNKKINTENTVESVASGPSEGVESNNARESGSTEENPKCVSETDLHEKEIEKKVSCQKSVETVGDQFSSPFNENVNMEVIEEDLTSQPSAMNDMEDVGLEKPYENVPETEETKQENMVAPAVDCIYTTVLKNHEITVEGALVNEERETDNLGMAVRNMLSDKNLGMEMSGANTAETEKSEQEISEKAGESVADTTEPQTKDLEMVDDDNETEVSKLKSQETIAVAVHSSEDPSVVDDIPTTKETKQGVQEMVVVDCVLEKQNENDVDMVTEKVVPIVNTIDPYVKAINDLAILKSQEELADLPLDLLLSCQEQLMAILSNTNTAIRFKCHPN